MGIDEIEWAGVRFLPLYRHDARFFRCPGLWAFARREFSGERTLLYVDHAENIASAWSVIGSWAQLSGWGSTSCTSISRWSNAWIGYCSRAMS
jgi:hypothetical protein